MRFDTKVVRAGIRHASLCANEKIEGTVEKILVQISRRHLQALIKRREHETGLAYCIRLGRCVRFTDQDIARLERAITIT